MKLLVVAVLLAVVQAPSPVPRKAADNAAGTRHPVKSDGNRNDGSTAPAPDPLKINGSGEAKGDSSAPSGKNAGESITVTKLPPVTVTRDWSDWIYVGFSGLLVVVGFLQVWLLCKTVRATRIAADAAAKGADTAEKTLRLTQRAFVGIHAAGVEPSGIVVLALINSGHTQAMNVLVDINITGGDASFQSMPPLGPVVIAAGGKQTVTVGKVQTWQDAAGQVHLKVPDLRISGKITYHDIFKDAHTTSCTIRFDQHRMTGAIEEYDAD